MVRVSKKWLNGNVEMIAPVRDNGTKAWNLNLKRRILEDTRIPKGGFSTTLTARAVTEIDWGRHDTEFSIDIPGYGWCVAATYPQTHRKAPRSNLTY
ncbi:MAG: hypothetical protein WC346_09695 [Methanogenium sp.]|jgi:hypothetical protein